MNEKLFKNAVDSLHLALEDYASDDPKRASSAVRNLHAGILLLFKTKLASLSDPNSNEVLIKKRIIPQRTPDGGITFVGEGKETVDVQQIKERFKALQIESDWVKFDKVNKLRNDLEHKYTECSKDVIGGVLGDAFIVIRDFMVDELAVEPYDHLDEEAWAVLLSQAQVFEKELATCQKKLKAVDWNSDALREAVLDTSCDECGSRLIAPCSHNRQHGIECRTCGESESFEKLAVRALCDHMAAADHEAYKEGGDAALIACPFCLEDSYVVDEKKCAVCDEQAAHTCDFCANEIPTCEITDGSTCGYCEHMLSKDD